MARLTDQADDTARRYRALRWAAAAWKLYGLYEYLIRLGILCDENCDIRMDLLLLYPALVLLTLAIAWRAWRAARRPPRTSPTIEGSTT